MRRDLVAGMYLPAGVVKSAETDELEADQGETGGFPVQTAKGK